MNRINSKVLGIAITIFAFVGVQGSLSSEAHANTITATSPAQNAVINTTPNVVSMTTDEPINQQGTSLQVIDPNGNEVDDHSLTVSGSTAVIGMQNLTTAGVYKVIYNIYFQTNSPLIGNYSFTFNSPGSITPIGSTETSTTSTVNSSGTTQNNSKSQTTPNQSTTNLNSSSGNTFVYILMLLALIVALGLLWYAYVLMERSRSKNSRSARNRK